MYEAFNPTNVAKKLPYEISCIASSNKVIFAGSKCGILMIFPIDPKRGYVTKEIIQSHNDNRPILKICISKRKSIYITFCENLLVVRSLDTPSKEIFKLTKFASISSIDLHEDYATNNLYLAISSQRKIFIYKWKEDKFVDCSVKFEPQQFLVNPSNLLWCNDSLAVAVKNDYYIATCQNQDFESADCIFTVSKIQNLKADKNACFAVLERKNLIAFAEEKSLHFYSSNDGIKSEKIRELKFSENITSVLYHEPYIVAVTEKGFLEVRSIDPNPMLVQKLEVSSLSMLFGEYAEKIMFATNRSIFYLDALPNLDKNIEYLRKEKQYEHAIELIQTYLPDKVKNIQELKFEMAMHCFQHKQFKKCFDILKEVQHDVIIVLYCFRAFLPEYDAPDELKHVNPESDTVIGESEKLPEKDNREFLKQLIDYLQDVRTINYELLRNNDKYKENNEEGKLLSDFEKKKILRILEISDTTIIQCYVHTEPFLIASKLRVSNFCNMVVTQKLLEKSQLFNDLFLLYKTRRKYQEAVELLIQQYSKESHMKSIENVVLYLQELGIFQIDLIFKYADWVFSKNFESGLQIFTDATDYHEVKTLDRKRVLEYFISSRHIEAVLPYLEHIVFTWKDPNLEFHESLGDHYIAHIKMNKIEYVHACSDDDTRIVAGHEEGEFGRLRRQLIRFLNESSTYNPNKMLTKLQGDYFYEEKAIVYGKLGKHKEALCILVTILMEYNEADAYCSKYYDPSVPKHSQIYSLLFEAYVKPFKTNIVDYSNTLNVERKADVGKALQILQKHCDKIDSVKAIELLPNDIPLTDLWPALSSVMKSRITQNEHSTLKLGIEKSIFTTMNAELTERRKQKIKIGFDDECNLCHQKISTSALACKEDGTLLDYSCFLKQKKQKQ